MHGSINYGHAMSSMRTAATCALRSQQHRSRLYADDCAHAICSMPCTACTAGATQEPQKADFSFTVRVICSKPAAMCAGGPHAE